MRLREITIHSYCSHTMLTLSRLLSAMNARQSHRIEVKPTHQSHFAYICHLTLSICHLDVCVAGEDIFLYSHLEVLRRNSR